MAKNSGCFMDDEAFQEIELRIDPRVNRLEELGISLGEFEAAVSKAMDERVDAAEKLSEQEELPPIEEVEVEIREMRLQLEDIAEIRISGDVADLGANAPRLNSSDQLLESISF